MPAIPALANGSRWDLVGRIVAAGRRDLFDGPVWQAVHNYSRNRPLDYPYDIGNQEGAAFTDRFYRAVAAEPWQADAWRGRTLAEVNRIRYDRRNPGASIADDHGCWLAYEHFDALNRKHLGRSIPILATECGYIVGEDTDPRYPATTPDLHMAQTLESCRVMMGTSQRFKHAPDYYFCTSFWLMANAHTWQYQRLVGRAGLVQRALAGRCTAHRPRPAGRAQGRADPHREVASRSRCVGSWQMPVTPHGAWSRTAPNLRMRSSTAPTALSLPICPPVAICCACRKPT